MGCYSSKNVFPIHIRFRFIWYNSVIERLMSFWSRLISKHFYMVMSKDFIYSHTPIRDCVLWCLMLSKESSVNLHFETSRWLPRESQRKLEQMNRTACYCFHFGVSLVFRDVNLIFIPIHIVYLQAVNHSRNKLNTHLSRPIFPSGILIHIGARTIHNHNRVIYRSKW